MDENKKFKVLIMYREPTFELRIGPKASPFTCTYNIKAVDETAAIAGAIKEFRMTASQSSVGWVRNIVSAEVIYAEESLS